MDCETGNLYISFRKLSECLLRFQTAIGHRVTTVYLKDTAVIKGTKQEHAELKKLKVFEARFVRVDYDSKRILELKEIFG